MQHNRSQALTDRLYVLTLALEAAFKEDNLADAQSLFEARSQIIQELQQAAQIDPSQLHRVAEVDKRIESEMLAKTTAIAGELRKSNLGASAQRAYRPGAAHNPITFQI